MPIKRIAEVVAGSLLAVASVVMADPDGSQPGPASTQVSPFVSSPLQQMVDQARQRAAEYAAHMPAMPAPLPADEQTQVQRLADISRQRGQAEYQALVQGKTTLEGLPNASPTQALKKPVKAPGLVVVALSSSMPEQMLRDYFVQLDGKPATLVVLRGFIDSPDHVKPTAEWLEKTMRRDPTCTDKCKHFHVPLAVDPLVYASLGITQVPAVTYLPGVHELKHCDGETFSSAGLVVGAASMEASLKALAKAGVTVPDSIQQVYEVKGWESRPQ